MRATWEPWAVSHQFRYAYLVFYIRLYIFFVKIHMTPWDDWNCVSNTYSTGRIHKWCLYYLLMILQVWPSQAWNVVVGYHHKNIILRSAQFGIFHFLFLFLQRWIVHNLEVLFVYWLPLVSWEFQSQYIFSFKTMRYQIVSNILLVWRLVLDNKHFLGKFCRGDFEFV